MLIYLPHHTPRSKYIFDKIFTEEFGLSYTTTNDRSEFERHASEKINYSATKFKDEFFIEAVPLLSQNSIHHIDVNVSDRHGLKVLFATDNSSDLGFDVFSAAFYMLSRYEEYLPYSPDKYGRFEAENSIAFKNDFLKIPVAEAWLGLLKTLLEKRFPSLSFKPSSFKAVVTYDIDVAYKFRGRTMITNAGSIAKDLMLFNFKNLKQRNKVFKKTSGDPWDTYDYLQKKIEQNHLNSIFFFLLGNRSKHDRNMDYRHPLMQQLIKKIAAFSEVGIHPSFYSSSSFEKIVSEKQRLEDLSGKTISRSRQHFLKFKLPDTYNFLINAGIREDYSMGFPYQCGFRAGTCKPFKFYDLKNEVGTELEIFPITMMEGNFMNEEFDKKFIVERIVDLLNEVKKAGGTFISIWHNHTVSATDEFREWRSVHDQMIDAIVEISN